jgi:hypothetical protein
MTPLTLRVAARFQKRLAGQIGDPKALLLVFESKIHALVIPPRDIEAARKVIQEVGVAMREPDPPLEKVRHWPGYHEATDLSYTAYFKTTTGRVQVGEVGQNLFLSILQSYSLPAGLRKKVEMASRAYLKPSKPRTKAHGDARYLEFFDIYEKFIATLQAHAEVAREAVAKGQSHSEEGSGATRIKVGDFVLVNTGGFSPEIMTNAADVVQKANAAAKSKGFANVCYGEVQITNTLTKSNESAFYLIANDELFIRANVRSSLDTTKTVLHELGHRYEHKFLKDKKREIEKVYLTIEGHEIDRRKEKPAVGETITSSGKIYKVTGTEWAARGIRVNLALEDNPKVTAHVSLDAWTDMTKGRVIDTPDYKGFITNYAKKGGPGENFAEMFAFYCLGKLPASQVDLFETLVR